MGALSVIGVTPGQEIGQKASAGIRYAHGAMDKGFYLQIIRDICPYLGYLLEGKLSACHHPFCPQFMPEIKGSVIDIIGLGAHMYLYLGAHLFCYGKNSGIGYDKGIRPVIAEGL